MGPSLLPFGVSSFLQVTLNTELLASWNTTTPSAGFPGAAIDPAVFISLAVAFTVVVSNGPRNRTGTVSRPILASSIPSYLTTLKSENRFRSWP